MDFLVLIESANLSFNIALGARLSALYKHLNTYLRKGINNINNTLNRRASLCTHSKFKYDLASVQLQFMKFWRASALGDRLLQKSNSPLGQLLLRYNASRSLYALPQWLCRYLAVPNKVPSSVSSEVDLFYTQTYTLSLGWKVCTGVFKGIGTLSFRYL